MATLRIRGRRILYRPVRGRSALAAETLRGSGVTMRTRAVTIVLTVAMSLAVATGAAAAPPHGDSGHTHHVHTGQGSCVDVNAVAFFAEDRGLHRGANASGTEQGIWHGPCH